jgi:uncharacterized membrane protein
MTEAETTQMDFLARVRRYRHLMTAAVVLGTLGFLTADYLGYPVVGVAVYWLGVCAFLAIWKGTDVVLFDERDRELERRAITLATLAFGVAMILLWPTMVVLSETGTYTPPPEFYGALLAFSAQAGLFVIAYLWLRYR